MLKNTGPVIPQAFAIAFLKGGAMIVILVWGFLSFAPLFAMIYGDLSVGMLLINLLFGITGVASLGSLYLLFVFLASTEGRRRLRAKSDHALFKLSGFAAAWLLFYSFAS